MRTTNRRSEKGIALVLSILALLLLSAIAVGMMYMSGTESAINANFKAEETEYFAARAGIEEIRDRMIPGVANYSINGLFAQGGCPGTPASPNCYLPTQMPTAANGQIVYILQQGVAMASVTTPAPAGQPNLFDDELCHDYTIGNMVQSAASNVPCAGANAQPNSTPAWYTLLPGAYGVSSVPTGSTGLAAPNWAIVGNASFNPMDWKWVRISLKANNSNPFHAVDGNNANAAAVCWNKTAEVPLVGAPTCQALVPPLNPVYLVTALAVNSTGARRVVQAELAQDPGNTQPGGLFATGTGCGALSIGGGAGTFSFNSSTEAGGPTNPPSNIQASGGNVGANGNVNISGNSTVVNGSPETFMPDTVGACNGNNGITKSGNPTFGAPTQLNTSYNPLVPPFPTNPIPGTSNVTYNGTQTIPPGGGGGPVTLQSVKITGGIIHLGVGATASNPAVYTMNSLSISGGGEIEIDGPVVININYSGNGVAVDLGGNGFVNQTAVASNFVINYGGFGNIQVNGGAQAYGVINAPNANVKLNGGSNFYGQVLGNTIDDSGGTSFYWDTAANTQQVNTNPFFEITMRELSY